MKAVVRFKSRRSVEYLVEDGKMIDTLAKGNFELLAFDDKDGNYHILNFKEVEEIEFMSE